MTYMTKAEAKSLKVGDVVRVTVRNSGEVDFHHHGMLERTAPAGSLYRVGAINTYGSLQGLAITASCIAGPGYGIDGVFDEADIYPELGSPAGPVYPFVKVDYAELAETIRNASDFVAEYEAALNDDEQEGGAIVANCFDFDALSNGLQTVLNAGECLGEVKLTHEGR